MAVIEPGRSRRNGMANIFTGVDMAFIEYLSSLAMSATTSSSEPNPTSTNILPLPHDVTLTSPNSDDSEDHSSDDGECSEVQDCR